MEHFGRVSSKNLVVEAGQPRVVREDAHRSQVFLRRKKTVHASVESRRVAVLRAAVADQGLAAADGLAGPALGVRREEPVRRVAELRPALGRAAVLGALVAVDAGLVGLGLHASQILKQATYSTKSVSAYGLRHSTT